MTGNNRRPADCPEWGWVIIQELRESSRRAEEDRRRAEADRKAMKEGFAELRAEVRQTTLAVRDMSESVRVMAEAVTRVSDLAAEPRGHLIQLQQETRAARAEQTKLLHAILRTLRAQGNGRSGNGRR